MYWAAAQLSPQRDRLALHCLALAGFETYQPRLREHRLVRGRRVEVSPPLFPGYAFVLVVGQWHAARWAPGVVRLVLDGDHPARVPEAVLAGIRARECGGLIELPRPPGPRRGDPVRILCGPFAGSLALYASMKPRQRVEVLLQLLGGTQRVTMPHGDIEPVPL
jgi:transcriptional antiterminator RfaH